MAQRALIIRYEGMPFLIRMSKMLRTVLDCGWECDLLIPQGGVGKVNISKEVGRDLAQEVRIHEFPRPRPGIERLLAAAGGPGAIHDRYFRQTLQDLLTRNAYSVVVVKDTPPLRQVFAALQASGQALLPVMCDMYENASEQSYDMNIRYGSWQRRAITTLRREITRIRAIERTYLPRCDRIFVVVEEAKKFLVERYGLDPRRIAVVHNVEVLEEFDRLSDPSVPPATGGEFTISYVGSMGPHRGIELLLDAILRLGNMNTPPFRLVLVGVQPQHRARLEEVCAALGIQGRVQMVDFVPHPTAMQWIKRSHIGVIPHADTEFIRTTIPNKLFQYMAAGAPCVVSDVGPLGRIVRETGCGLAHDPGSAASLAAQIAVLLHDPALARGMGQRGRAAAEQRYRWELQGRQYEEYLDSLAGNGL